VKISFHKIDRQNVKDNMQMGWGFYKFEVCPCGCTNDKQGWGFNFYFFGISVSTKIKELK